MPAATRRSKSRAGRENGETSNTKKLKRHHHSRVKQEMETPPVTPPSSNHLEETQQLDVTMMDTEQWVDTGEDLLVDTANGHGEEYDAPLISPIFDDNNNNGSKKNKRQRRASNRLAALANSSAAAEKTNGLDSPMTNGNLSSSVDLDGTTESSGRRASSRTGRKRKQTPPPTFEDSDDDDTLNDDDDFVAPSTPPSKKKRRAGNASQDVGSTKPKPASRLRTRTRRRASSEEEGATNSCSGILKSIKMYNFMCHKGFFQEWHPNLNFITGENGSGKSALLTGLLIGLGAKATLTSRTRSTASLIQKGKDSARTEITLLNNGALPYDKYGNEVMIERTLSKNGSSAYRLKAHGTFHKLKRHELDYILLSLNIQLDNPVAILNQEVAKNFLRTKDPKDKYKLFYQGTLLSKLFELMADSRNAIDVSRKNLMCQKNLLYDLRTEIRELEGKLKEVQNLSNIRMKNKELGVEYLWALVKDEGKQKEKFQKDVEGHEEAIRKLESNLDASKEKKRTLLQEMDPGQDGTAEIKKKIKEKEAALEITRRELNDAQKQIQKYNAGRKLNRETIRKKERLYKDVSDMLEKIKSNTEVDKERAIREYEENKTKLLAEKLKVNEELLSLKRECEQFYNGVSAAGDQLNNMMDEVRAYKNSYDSKKRQLDTLQSKGSNKYAIFGRSMEILMAKINSNLKKFSKPPRGPIGAHLTVKDPKFIGLAEHVLRSKNFLVTFMVNNSDDLILLKKMIQESYNGTRNDYGRPSISSTMPAIKVNAFSDRAYDLGRGAARIRGVSNLLDLLEVDKNDCVIVNGLIDYVDAESTLMFEDNKQAAYIMKDSTRFPASTKHGYTLEGYRFLPFPNYAAHFQNTQGARAVYLKSSAKAQIEDLKTALLELQEKINVINPLLDKKRKEEAELKRRHGSMIAQQENKRQILSRMERSLKDNESKKYKEPDLASHEEEAHDLRGQIQEHEAENQNYEQRTEETNRKIEALQNQKEELQFSMNKLQKSIDNSVSERQKKKEEIQSIEKFLDRLVGKIADLRRAKEPTMNNFTKSQSEYERKLQQAQEAGPQVQCSRSALDVKREVEALRIRIAAMEKHIGDAEKIKNDYQKKRTEFRVKTKEFQPIWRCFTMLKDLINSQVTFLFRKRMGITNGLTFMYEGLVHQRGYKGQMKIDHDTKELHYYICPDQSSTNRTNEAIGDNDKQTKKSLIEYSLGLSGGERSFSTICFIISLWQVMECPFYMLDEFDVFMDVFNRKTSQQALITHAKNQLTRQFFLFSPLDLVEIPSQDEATVIRLQPARPDKKTSVSPDNESENVDPAPRSSPTTHRKGPRSRPRRGSTSAMSEKNSSSARR